MIIVIASAKGGSAKSTTAQHLAAYLASRRGVGPVVLSDADQNETSLSWFNRGLENPKLPEPKFTVVGADEAVDPDDYDHLIVDSAAAPDSAELAELMEVADLLIVPTAPSIFDLEAAIATTTTLEVPPEQYSLLLTLVPPGNSNQGPQAYQALKDAELSICKHWVCRRSVYAQAAIAGATVNQLKGKPAQTAWKEYQMAFKTILRGRL